MMNIGVNLYSLRTLIKTEEDFLATSLALKKMGYNCLQYSGAPFDAEMIKRVVNKSGIPVVLTHVPLDRIISDTDNLIREHIYAGIKYIGLGALPFDKCTDPEYIKATVAALEVAAEKIEREGLRFFYHNHHTDCYRNGGVTNLDYMIENAPHIHFTLDTYWLQYGGLSVTDYIDRLGGRIECVHLKDYKIIATQSEDGKYTYKPTFAPVGEGNLDFAGYMPHMRAAGVEYYLVEQDNAVSFDDPLDEVRRSIENIKLSLT